MKRKKIDIPPDDPVGEIRELANQRYAGHLTDEEYQERFQELNRRHGELCACGRGTTVYVHPTTGAHLCGECALEVIG